MRQQADPIAQWLVLHEALAAHLEDQLDEAPVALVDAFAAWLDETAAQRQALRAALLGFDAEGAARAEIRYLDEIQALVHRLVVLRGRVESRLREDPRQLERFRELARSLDV